MESWAEKLLREPPSFILAQLPHIGTHNGTRYDRKMIRGLARLARICSSTGCVMFIIGSASLPTWHISEMQELRDSMHRSLVRWCNFGIAHSDGALSSIASQCWCSAHGLPDLSEKPSGKTFANDASGDRDTSQGVSRTSVSCNLFPHSIRTTFGWIPRRTWRRTWRWWLRRCRTPQTRPEF